MLLLNYTHHVHGIKFQFSDFKQIIQKNIPFIWKLKILSECMYCSIYFLDWYTSNACIHVSKCALQWEFHVVTKVLIMTPSINLYGIDHVHWLCIVSLLIWYCLIVCGIFSHYYIPHFCHPLSLFISFIFSHRKCHMKHFNLFVCARWNGNSLKCNKNRNTFNSIKKYIFCTLFCYFWKHVFGMCVCAIRLIEWQTVSSTSCFFCLFVGV